MLPSAAVGVLVALATAAPGPKTLWLVEPLYPGQERLVSRSEEALARLMAGQADQVVGAKGLSVFLAGRQADLRCLLGEVSCADPIDSFVAGLGLSRVVLLKGGQEEAGYRFKVVSYQPETGETASAEGLNPNLEKALLSASVKVVPLASTLEVGCEPAGAVIYVDGERVGTSPYSGQVLPGERTVRIEAAGHAPVEKKLEVPVRGTLKVNEKLEKIPARLVVAAGPKGTRISVDGRQIGVDSYDGAIQPGSHHLSFELDGYLPRQKEVEVKPGDIVRLNEDLEPTGWTNFKGALTREQEALYGRKTSFLFAYERASLYGDSLYARTNPFKSPFDPVEPGKASPSNKTVAQRLEIPAPLQGLSVEAHEDGRYFGLLLAGLGWYRSTEDWQFSVINRDPAATLPGASGTGQVDVVVVRALQPHLRFALWRFVFVGQLGFELRGFMVRYAPVDTLYAVDVELATQLALRFQVVEGMFLEASYRRELSVPWSDTAPLMGFHGGLGYAF